MTDEVPITEPGSRSLLAHNVHWKGAYRLRVAAERGIAEAGTFAGGGALANGSRPRASDLMRGWKAVALHDAKNFRVARGRFHRSKVVHAPKARMKVTAADASPSAHFGRLVITQP